MARQGTELLARMCEGIVRLHESAEDELMSYMSDLGISWSEQWRREFLDLVTRRNENYRKNALQKLRIRATHVRQLHLQSPLHVQVEAAVNDGQRLQMQLTKVEDIYATHLDTLHPEIKEDLVAEVGRVKDLVKLVSTRTREVRVTFTAIRRDLHPILTEHAFEALVDRLKSPLPTRVQRRPLYLIAERLRAQREMRLRIVKKADRMRRTLTAVANWSLPDTVADQVTHLRDGMQRAGWRQGDLIYDLECLLMKAETSPSSLVLEGQEISIQDIFRTIRRSELLRVDLEALHERATSVEGRLHSLFSILAEPQMNST